MPHQRLRSLGAGGRAHLIERPARRDDRGMFHCQFAARLGLLAPFQFVREHFRELFRRHLAAKLDVNYVRRKTPQLIPRHHIVRRVGNDLPGA